MSKTTRRSSILIALVALVAIIGVSCLVGCSQPGKMATTMYAGYEDVASGATYYSGDKELGSFKVAGKRNEKKNICIDLGEPKQFNTIVLGESSKAVTMFSIYGSNEKSETSMRLIYEGDTIEDFRLCFVGNVAYRYLRVEVNTATDSYNVNSIKVYNNQNKDTSKRVCTYLLLDRVHDTDLSALDTVTDIIVFSWLRFNSNGDVTIYIDDPDKKGEFLPQDVAKAKYIEELTYLKEKVNEIEVAQNRKITIFADILMPWSDTPGDNNKYARAIMSPDKAETTANNISAFIDELGFDGIDLDYEYPYSREEIDLYNKFLPLLKSKLGEGKLLSTALGAWNINLSKEAIDAIDRVELMTYDIFDKNGYHAPFNSCMLRDLDTAMKKGIPAEKINLGLPFYSRPISRAGYWGDYFRFFEDDLGVLNSNNPTAKYKNVVTFPAKDSGNNLINDPEYFNGYQMIQDKMAFAIDSPVAGIMIWHMNCDIEYKKDLSLFRAIKTTFTEKGASLVTNK